MNLTTVTRKAPIVLVDTKTITLEEWKEWRRKGIGGSDAPAIVGANPYASKWDVWKDKIYGSDFEGNEATEWGERIEPLLAQKFMDNTGKKLRNRYAILGHPEHDWMLANVDRLVVGEDAGWEGKTTNAFYKDEGEAKELYWVQCQHYMAVTGKSKWYISVLAGGQRYYQYEAERDDDYIENVLIPAEEKLWQHVQNEELPEYDGSDACTRMLEEMNPVGNSELVLEIDDDSVRDMIERFTELTGQEKVISEEKKTLANTIKAELGEHSKAVAGDRSIYWSNVSSKKFDSKAFQKDNPELYEQYTKESSYRRFQIK